LLILLNQIYTMNKIFIVRLFTIITLILFGAAPVFSNNNKNFVAVHKTMQIPAAKPAPVEVKQAPVYKPVHRKPTREDTILMRDKTLSGQYKYLLTKTYHIQEPFITSFYKNLKDTINVERRKRQEAEAKLAVQTKTTNDLQTNVSEKEKSLAQSNARVNSVNFLGIYIDKSVYNLIMWGLVIALGATAAVVIIRSGSHSREARYRINLYNELEEEFKTYKAKANEKEKRLARELQTERNKVDELMGRS
jgi:Skp family chaperone for outer membrane proteins